MFLPPLFKRLIALVWGVAFFMLGLFQRIVPSSSSTPADGSLAAFLSDWDLDADGLGTAGLRRPAAQATWKANTLPAFEPAQAAVDWRTKRVAVLETGEAHDEVTGALIYSLLDSGLEPRFFRRHGFRFHFLEAIASFWPSPAWESADDGTLERAILADEIDVLILATCSETLPDLLPTLLAQPSGATHAVCLQHWSNDLKDHSADYLPLAAERRLSLVALADHVAASMRGTLDALAVDRGEPAWEAVDVKTFVPVFPVAAAVDVHARKPSGGKARKPAKVGIQGNIENGRRDYSRVFTALDKAIRLDPRAWGYELLRDTQELSSSSDGDATSTGAGRLYPLRTPGAPEPFELHLLGKVEHLPVVPALLRDVVFIHEGLPYTDFYALLASMDLLLPAFGHKGYLEHMASSSIPAALIARIPVLAAPQLTQAYTYVSGPALARHPNSMETVEALRRLRAGGDPMEGVGRRPSWGEEEEDGEEEEGGGWEAYERRLAGQNERLWQTLLARA